MIRIERYFNLLGNYLEKKIFTMPMKEVSNGVEISISECWFSVVYLCLNWRFIDQKKLGFHNNGSQ